MIRGKEVNTLANDGKDSKAKEAAKAKESPKPQPIRPNPTLKERGGQTPSDLEEL